MFLRKNIHVKYGMKTVAVEIIGIWRIIYVWMLLFTVLSVSYIFKNHFPKVTLQQDNSYLSLRLTKELFSEHWHSVYKRSIASNNCWFCHDTESLDKPGPIFRRCQEVVDLVVDYNISADLDELKATVAYDYTGAPLSVEYIYPYGSLSQSGIPFYGSSASQYMVFDAHLRTFDDYGKSSDCIPRIRVSVRTCDYPEKSLTNSIATCDNIPPRYGDQCVFSCFHGYQPLNANYSVQTCQMSGEFDAGGSYDCEAIRCGAYEVPSNAKATCINGDSFNSVCKLECMHGYAHINEDFGWVKCELDGTWTTSNFSCDSEVSTACPDELSCGVSPDPCYRNMCQNNGTCISTNASSSDYYCHCRSMTTGHYCEMNIVNGGWSSFGENTPCSLTCGVGLMYQFRVCNNPPPQNGGLDCIGNSMKSHICETHMPCPGCQQFNTSFGVNAEFSGNRDSMTVKLFCPPCHMLRPNINVMSCSKDTGYQWNHSTLTRHLPKCVEESLLTTMNITYSINYQTVQPINQSLDFNRMPATKLWPDRDLPDCSNFNQSNAVSDIVFTCATFTEMSVATDDIVTLSVYTSASFDMDRNVTVSCGSYLHKKRSVDYDMYMGLMDEQVSDIVNYLNSSMQNISSAKQPMSSGGALELPGYYVLNRTSVSQTHVLLCDSGQEPVHGMCADCPPGTYGMHGTCELCPRGTYQDLAGMDHCKQCQQGYTTAFRSAVDNASCSVYEETTMPSSTSGTDLLTTGIESVTGNSIWIIILFTMCLVLGSVSAVLSVVLYIYKKRKKFSYLGNDSSIRNFDLHNNLPDLNIAQGPPPYILPKKILNETGQNMENDVVHELPMVFTFDGNHSDLKASNLSRNQPACSVIVLNESLLKTVGCIRTEDTKSKLNLKKAVFSETLNNTLEPTESESVNENVKTAAKKPDSPCFASKLFSSKGGELRLSGSDSHLNIPPNFIPPDTTCCISFKVNTNVDLYQEHLQPGYDFIAPVIECDSDLNVDFDAHICINIAHCLKSDIDKGDVLIMYGSATWRKPYIRVEKHSKANYCLQDVYYTTDSTYINIYTKHFTNFMCCSNHLFRSQNHEVDIKCAIFQKREDDEIKIQPVIIDLKSLWTLKEFEKGLEDRQRKEGFSLYESQVVATPRQLSEDNVLSAELIIDLHSCYEALSGFPLCIERRFGDIIKCAATSYVPQIMGQYIVALVKTDYENRCFKAIFKMKCSCSDKNVHESLPIRINISREANNNKIIGKIDEPLHIIKPTTMKAKSIDEVFLHIGKHLSVANQMSLTVKLGYDHNKLDTLKSDDKHCYMFLMLDAYRKKEKNFELNKVLQMLEDLEENDLAKEIVQCQFVKDLKDAKLKEKEKALDIQLHVVSVDEQF